MWPHIWCSETFDDATQNINIKTCTLISLFMSAPCVIYLCCIWELVVSISCQLRELNAYKFGLCDFWPIYAIIYKWQYDSKAPQLLSTSTTNAFRSNSNNFDKRHIWLFSIEKNEENILSTWGRRHFADVRCIQVHHNHEMECKRRP